MAVDYKLYNFMDMNNEWKEELRKLYGMEEMPTLESFIDQLLTSERANGIPVNTPDTDVEIKKTCRDCNHLISGEETYACNDCIKALLSSRDSYWKERVRKDIQRMIETSELLRKGNNPIDWERGMNTLLDNLK